MNLLLISRDFCYTDTCLIKSPGRIEVSVQGKNLAEFIQEELNLKLKVKRPRVAKGNKTYYLLKRSESVMNIVECGFLTNPEEAGLLCKEEYQNKIVEAIVNGIEEYLKQQKN